MENMKIPVHVGFIMDGNGRWATERKKPRTYGHRKAVANVTEVVQRCFELGVETVSLYAFSTENWKRPKEEVDALFDLLRKYFNRQIKKILKNGVRLTVMGDISALPEPVREDIVKSVESTKGKVGKTLNIGINYGGRAEIVRAANKLIEEGKSNITEEEFSKALYTGDLKDPDLIVRTGGEKRLSNFMLYQMAYSELYFSDKMWPDFHAEDVDEVFLEYGNRHRRFGKIK